jgi:phage baseplate assembly protein V
MTLEMIEKYIGPLKRRVLQSVARAVITAIADDKGLQKLQVELLADELHSNVDRVQNYGFTSAPLPGAEGVFLSVGGSREHGVIIAVDDRRYRLKPLAPGEVALYTDEGDKIHFKRGNKIEINSGAEINLIAASKVTVTAPDATVTCTNATVTASTKATVTAPEIDLTAATKVQATTPLLNVSGVISCSGIATGGGVATPGNATINGSLSATGDVSAAGDVEDGAGSMQEMRDTYNTHTHPETGVTTGAPNEPMS